MSTTQFPLFARMLAVHFNQLSTSELQRRIDALDKGEV